LGNPLFDGLPDEVHIASYVASLDDEEYNSVMSGLDLNTVAPDPSRAYPHDDMGAYSVEVVEVAKYRRKRGLL
jgi:hypothetical protein